MKIAFTVVAGSAVAVLALTGCSSSSDQRPSDVASSVGSDVQGANIPAPIVIEPSQTMVSATVGDALDFNVGAKPGKWDIESDDPTIVAVTKGGKNNGATFNPGGQALAPGTAKVTLTDTSGGSDAMVYTITVSQ